MDLQPIYVNKTGRITSGKHEGVVGKVVGADWEGKTIDVENSEGAVITVAWGMVKQFKD